LESRQKSAAVFFAFSHLKKVSAVREEKSGSIKKETDVMPDTGLAG